MRETEELDPSIRPQDDLYRHVNGRWLERFEIPADKARYGSFHVLSDEAELAVREILEDPAPTGEHAKVARLYRSFLDEEAIEAKGAEPIAALLAEVDAVTDAAALLPAMGRLERGGVGGLLGLFVDNDPGDPERYVVLAEQSGIRLPDESYYREEHFAELREQYLAHVTRMFALAGLEGAGDDSGDDSAASRAARVLALETDIAAAHWDNVRTRDAQATYNPTPWAALVAASGRDLDGWLAALDAPAGTFDTVIVREPSFVEAAYALITPERLPAWRDWLRWGIVHAYAPYLSSAFVAENFAFYGTALSGTPELRARWKRGVSFVEGGMGEAVGRIYVERHFPESAKRACDELVGHLVEAYRDSIERLDWMTDATRAKALEKLAKFTPKIGYPVKWRDYSALEVGDDLVANVRAIDEFEFHRELGKIGKPIDRDEWFMTPQTINAYYNPGFNEIVFPAAILQWPFFDEGRDAAFNFGAIGAVIGHEIGHGFDDQGSRYDGDGRLTDWWTDADRAAFEARTSALIAQYDALEPAETPGHHVSGALTIGENIGDLGGLGIAWKAYLRSLGGAAPATIDGLSAAERFFLAWANAWRTKIRPEEALRLLSIDPHSPSEFRCNQIVRNLDVFHDTFAVAPGDALWLAPEERVAIW